MTREELIKELQWTIDMLEKTSKGGVGKKNKYLMFKHFNNGIGDAVQHLLQIKHYLERGL
jgi:hypothetical protein